MLLDRDKSQLLIVDVQEKLLPAVSDPERVVERCVRLVRAARRLEIPITFSEQYPSGIGPTVAPLREALDYAGAVLEKVEFSCMKNGPLRERLHELRRKGRPQVVIGGIEAHVCVAQTAIDLEEQGFESFVVADAVSSRAKASRRLALARLLKAGADIVDSEMVLFEWMGKSGTPEFKELHALVK
ncbi:MAG: hydrolase [Methyloceanibacter sp.]|jgi:nicotinamidase-related amidase